MEHKLNTILNILVKISTKISNIPPSTIQDLLHNWVDQDELIQMSYQIANLIEPSVPLLSTHSSLLEEHLQKQQVMNRQMVRKQLLLNQKLRQLREQHQDLRKQYEQKVMCLKKLQLNNGQLKYELAKTTKSYSLQLGQKQLLINTNINLINEERWGKTEKDRDKLFEKDKTKKLNKHKRGKSDDPNLKKERYKYIR